MTTSKAEYFDVLIIGAGASGLSCALTLGSGLQKPFAQGKSVALLSHQKSSALQRAVLNNVLGIAPGTLGSTLLSEGLLQLQQLYPDLRCLEGKALRIEPIDGAYRINTTQGELIAQTTVVAIGSGQPCTLEGLEVYIMPHAKARPEKNRIQLRHTDLCVAPGLYVTGTLAGVRSQVAIAMGTGASVATDIMTAWNQGQHVQIHDALPPTAERNPIGVSEK